MESRRQTHGQTNVGRQHRKLSPTPDTFLLHSRAPDLHWTFPVLPETMPAHTQTRKAKDKHMDS